MAIQLHKENRVTFSKIFSSMEDFTLPFYKKANDGTLKQAWIVINLITQHVSIKFTQPIGECKPALIGSKGVAVIPLPSAMTARQMLSLQQRGGATHEEQFDFIGELKHAAQLGVEADPEGRAIVPKSRELLDRINRIYGYLSDFEEVNQQIDLRQIPLSELGLKAYGDDGKYHKDTNKVTQLVVKETGELLLTKEQAFNHIRRLESHYLNKGISATLLYAEDLLYSLADITQRTQLRLYNDGYGEVITAQDAYDSLTPVDIEIVQDNADEEAESIELITLPKNISLTSVNAEDVKSCGVRMKIKRLQSRHRAWPSGKGKYNEPKEAATYRIGSAFRLHSEKRCHASKTLNSLANKVPASAWDHTQLRKHSAQCRGFHACSILFHRDLQAHDDVKESNETFNTIHFLRDAKYEAQKCYSQYVSFDHPFYASGHSNDSRLCVLAPKAYRWPNLALAAVKYTWSLAHEDAEGAHPGLP